ncbi:MAG: type II toxin-antitoxin system RelB/DinJ family antitoxin [Candidatus Jacksonbacteria bacterium]|nr:type II toxin-antitoxin system RelB/DinJ family antitoxin [Candidatus Jacksonbacteria bacterium]
MKTLLNFKIDTELKEEAQRVASELGFPLSTLLNAYVRQLIKNRSVYFNTKPDTHTMPPALEEELEEVERDIHSNKNLSRSFSDVQDAITYLHRKSA